MKNKTAKEVLKILKLLISEDIESVKLGISLFQDCYLIKDYPNNKIFEINCKWPDSHFKPSWMDNFRSYFTKFTRQQFLKMLNSSVVSESKKVCCILNFVSQITDGRRIRKFKNSKKYKIIPNRNYNHQLNNLLWGTFKWLSSKEISSEPIQLYGKKDSYIYFRLCNNKNKISEDKSKELLKELSEYINGSELYKNLSFANDKSLYKAYLTDRYNKKKKILYRYFRTT